MKRILFIESDEDIRDLVADHIGRLAKEFDLVVTESLPSGRQVFEKAGGGFDALIIDGLLTPLADILVFVKEIRGLKKDLPAVVLVGYADMILDDQLKVTLKREKISLMNKLWALQPDHLPYLLESSILRGHGEVL